jgi:hypothetical protein
MEGRNLTKIYWKRGNVTVNPLAHLTYPNKNVYQKIKKEIQMTYPHFSPPTGHSEAEPEDLGLNENSLVEKHRYCVRQGWQQREREHEGEERAVCLLDEG